MTGDDAREGILHSSGHGASISAHVEVGTLFQQAPDLGARFFQALLHIHLVPLAPTKPLSDASRVHACVRACLRARVSVCVRLRGRLHPGPVVSSSLKCNSVRVIVLSIKLSVSSQPVTGDFDSQSACAYLLAGEGSEEPYHALPMPAVQEISVEIVLVPPPTPEEEQAPACQVM